MRDSSIPIFGDNPQKPKGKKRPSLAAFWDKEAFIESMADDPRLTAWERSFLKSFQPCRCTSAKQDAYLIAIYRKLEGG